LLLTSGECDCLTIIAQTKKIQYSVITD